jgi:hypothetical protein
VACKHPEAHHAKEFSKQTAQGILNRAVSDTDISPIRIRCDVERVLGNVETQEELMREAESVRGTWLPSCASIHQ